MADPGLPREGTPTPRGAPTHFLVELSWKPHEHEENWAERKGHRWKICLCSSVAVLHILVLKYFTSSVINIFNVSTIETFSLVLNTPFVRTCGLWLELRQASSRLWCEGLGQVVCSQWVINQKNADLQRGLWFTVNQPSLSHHKYGHYEITEHRSGGALKVRFKGTEPGPTWRHNTDTLNSNCVVLSNSDFIRFINTAHYCLKQKAWSTKQWFHLLLLQIFSLCCQWISTVNFIRVQNNWLLFYVYQKLQRNGAEESLNKLFKVLIDGYVLTWPYLLFIVFHCEFHQPIKITSHSLFLFLAMSDAHPKRQIGIP